MSSPTIMLWNVFWSIALAGATGLWFLQFGDSPAVQYETTVSELSTPLPKPPADEISDTAQTIDEWETLQAEINDLRHALAQLNAEPGKDFLTAYMRISAEVEKEFTDANILFGMAQRQLYRSSGLLGQRRAGLLIGRGPGSILAQLNLEPERLATLMKQLSRSQYEHTLHLMEQQAGAIPTSESKPVTPDDLLRTMLTADEYRAYAERLTAHNAAKARYSTEIDLFRINPAVDLLARREIAEIYHRLVTDQAPEGESPESQLERIHSAAQTLRREFSGSELNVIEDFIQQQISALRL